jgi:hypothetical protein
VDEALASRTDYRVLYRASLPDDTWRLVLEQGQARVSPHGDDLWLTALCRAAQPADMAAAAKAPVDNPPSTATAEAPAQR